MWRLSFLLLFIITALFSITNVAAADTPALSLKVDFAANLGSSLVYPNASVRSLLCLIAGWELIRAFLTGMGSVVGHALINLCLNGPNLIALVGSCLLWSLTVLFLLSISVALFLFIFQWLSESQHTAWFDSNDIWSSPASPSTMYYPAFQSQSAMSLVPQPSSETGVIQDLSPSPPQEPAPALNTQAPTIVPNLRLVESSSAISFTSSISDPFDDQVNGNSQSTSSDPGITSGSPVTADKSEGHLIVSEANSRPTRSTPSSTSCGSGNTNARSIVQPASVTSEALSLSGNASINCGTTLDDSWSDKSSHPNRPTSGTLVNGTQLGSSTEHGALPQSLSNPPTSVAGSPLGAAFTASTLDCAAMSSTVQGSFQAAVSTPRLTTASSSLNPSSKTRSLAYLVDADPDYSADSAAKTPLPSSSLLRKKPKRTSSLGPLDGDDCDILLPPLRATPPSSPMSKTGSCSPSCPFCPDVSVASSCSKDASNPIRTVPSPNGITSGAGQTLTSSAATCTMASDPLAVQSVIDHGTLGSTPAPSSPATSKLSFPVFPLLDSPEPIQDAVTASPLSPQPTVQDAGLDGHASIYPLSRSVPCVECPQASEVQAQSLSSSALGIQEPVHTRPHIATSNIDGPPSKILCPLIDAGPSKPTGSPMPTTVAPPPLDSRVGSISDKSSEVRVSPGSRPSVGNSSSQPLPRAYSSTASSRAAARPIFRARRPRPRQAMKVKEPVLPVVLTPRVNRNGRVSDVAADEASKGKTMVGQGGQEETASATPKLKLTRQPLPSQPSQQESSRKENSPSGMNVVCGPQRLNFGESPQKVDRNVGKPASGDQFQAEVCQLLTNTNSSSTLSAQEKAGGRNTPVWKALDLPEVRPAGKDEAISLSPIPVPLDLEVPDEVKLAVTSFYEGNAFQPHNRLPDKSHLAEDRELETLIDEVMADVEALEY